MVSECFRNTGGIISLNSIISRSDSLYAEEEILTFSWEMICFSFYVDSQGCITQNSQNRISKKDVLPKKRQASWEFTDFPSTTLSTDHHFLSVAVDPGIIRRTLPFCLDHHCSKPHRKVQGKCLVHWNHASFIMNPALLDFFPGPVCPILLVVALPFVSVDVPERMSPWFTRMRDDDNRNVPSIWFIFPA